MSGWLRPTSIPNSFGFSVSELASSLGVKIRGLLGSRSAVDQVRDIVDPGALQYNYYRGALEVLSTWTANSKFSGLVRVNQPLKPGFINFFILEHNYLAMKAPGLSCGCSYIPGSWSIVCDGLFLASAQRLLDSDQSSSEQEAGEFKTQNGAKRSDDEREAGIGQMYRNFLFQWVIAHELGHLVNNHTEQDLVRSWKYDDGTAVGLAAEKEADEFYISRLQHRQDLQAFTWLGLSNVVTRLYGLAIRAQHTASEIQEQIQKHGPDFVFATDIGIRVHYVADKHPPFLLRALNLADLVIARYPQMVDTTGYFGRIRDRIKLERSNMPNSPELCRAGVGSDEDESEEQLLAIQVETLLAQSAPRAWTDAVIGKLRSLVSKQKNATLRNVSALSTNLVEALAQPNIAATRAGIEQVEAASLTLPEPHKSTLLLLTLVAKARSGLLPDATSVKDALKDGQELLNKMARSGAIDLTELSGRVDALRLLMLIAMAHGKERDAATETIIDNILGEVSNLPNIADVYKQLLLQILEADFAWMSQISPSSEQAGTLARARAAMRLASLAKSQRWPVIEANYLASGLALMERIKSKPQDELLIGYLDLGRVLMTIGPRERAPSMYQRAIDIVDSLLASSVEASTQKMQIASMRLIGLNQLGWSLIANQRFDDAITPLKAAREGWVIQRGSRERCDNGQKADAELANTNQNLADASLAIGRFGEAFKYASEARQCRSQLGIAVKVLESTKTEGFALMYSGKQTDGKALLQTYSDGIRKLIDDETLPVGDQFISGAFVDHKFVSLEQFVHAIDKNHSDLQPIIPRIQRNVGDKK